MRQILYLAHVHVTTKRSAKLGFLFHFPFHKTLFPSFLHHFCLQFLYPTNFLVRECFSLLVPPTPPPLLPLPMTLRTIDINDLVHYRLNRHACNHIYVLVITHTCTCISNYGQEISYFMCTANTCSACSTSKVHIHQRSTPSPVHLLHPHLHTCSSPHSHLYTSTSAHPHLYTCTHHTLTCTPAHTTPSPVHLHTPHPHLYTCTHA